MKKPMSYEERHRLQSDLENEISELSSLTRRIQTTLNDEKKTREGLGEYLEMGSEALKKINGSLMQMGSNYSIFGCNGLIVVGIAVATIIVLMMF